MAGIKRPKVLREVVSVREGEVVLTYPTKMTAADFEDFESWLRNWLDRVKRRAPKRRSWTRKLKAVGETTKTLQDDPVEPAKEPR